MVRHEPPEDPFSGWSGGKNMQRVSSPEGLLRVETSPDGLRCELGPERASCERYEDRPYVYS